MLQYLYRIRPERSGFYGAPTVEEVRAVDLHFLYLKRASEQGTVILAGRTLNEDEAGFGIVVFTAPSEQEARSFANADPAVQAGVFRMDLFPFRVALAVPRP
ncbi:MAG: YciI family protein [Candidatus Bipolaricaulis sp.]|nr:YciI family protein [Candidatus Bipolaricaulis sp.]